MVNTILLATFLLYSVNIAVSIYCKDTEQTKFECLKKAIKDEGEWVTCDYCLCRTLGGVCNDGDNEDILGRKPINTRISRLKSNLFSSNV